MAEARAAIDRSGLGYGSTRWAPRVAFYGTGRQPPGPGRERSTRRTARQSSGRLLLPQAAATECYLLTDDEGGELTAGVRPAPAEEERAQGKVHGFFTPLLQARVSGKRLHQCLGVNPRLHLEEFQLSLGDSARAVRT